MTVDSSNGLGGQKHPTREEQKAKPFMPRGPATFRQRDLTAAVRAVVAAGVEVARVEVGSDGKIVVVAGKPSENETPSELDRELHEFEAKHHAG